MAADDVTTRLDKILKQAKQEKGQNSRVLAGRALERTADAVRMAVSTGIVEVPLDAVKDLQPYGEAGHVRLLITAPERIRPISGPGVLPAPCPTPPGWPGMAPKPPGPRGGPSVGPMSDCTWTQYCEDTTTITYGITADATDDSWCADDCDDWQ